MKSRRLGINCDDEMESEVRREKRKGFKDQKVESSADCFIFIDQENIGSLQDLLTRKNLDVDLHDY